MGPRKIADAISIAEIVFCISWEPLGIMKILPRAKDPKLRTQSFTSLKADPRQDINGGFDFSRCLNGTFP